MVLFEDDLASVTNVKKRMPHGEDIFLRARDFYHAHEDMHMWVGIAERSGMYPAEMIAKMRAAIDDIPDEARPALAKQVSDFFSYGSTTTSWATDKRSFRMSAARTTT